MNTLEERVASLERELSELKKQLAHHQSAKDWRRSIGIFADDPVFAEMVREGRKYREEQREPDSR